MVLYICKQQDSDMPLTGVLFAKEMSENTETAGGINISLAAGVADNGLFITLHGTPNSDSWESGGTITFLLNITATNGGGNQWRARCRVQRRDSAGNILETGAFTGFQNISSTGVKTFSITVPTWTSQEACGNRLVVIIQFNNTSAATRTCTIETGTINASADSPITENTGNCRRVFIS